MVEVLVTIVVMSVALLGVAKMQAAALSNTQVSRVRSLIALQAASLASMMHGNRGYWGAGVAPASITLAGTTVTDSTGVLNSVSTDCTTTACTPAQQAAYDVNDWASSMMNPQFPSYGATVACNNVAGQPVSCTINVTWSEKYVAINTTTAASAASASAVSQSYTLYVEP